MSPNALHRIGLPPATVELKPGIWYLDLDRLDDEAFGRWLQSPGACEGIIFDLRGYPQLSPVFLRHLTGTHLLGIPAAVPIMTWPDRRAWDWDGSGRLSLDPLPPRLPGKIIFLAGGGSASYAESCLAMMKEYRLAEILGAPTAGANGRFVSLGLPCGLTMTFTGMRVLTYDGACFHGVGVLPDRVIRPTWKGLKASRDELIEHAVAILSR
jgi:hypothetical protein